MTGRIRSFGALLGRRMVLRVGDDDSDRMRPAARVDAPVVVTMPPSAGHPLLDVPVLDDERTHRFVLESIFGGIAWMVPSDRRGVQFARDLDRGVPLDVVAAVDDGILRARSLALRWSERGRTLRIATPRAMTFVQRRRSLRFPARFPAVLRVVDGARSREVRGRTDDVSIGGFAVSIDGVVGVGDQVVLHVDLPAGPIEVLATVTSVEMLHRRTAHLRIDDMSDDDYTRLATSLRVVEEDLERLGIRL